MTIIYYSICILYIFDNQIFVYYYIKQSLTSYFIINHRGLRLYSYLCTEDWANVFGSFLASCIFVATNPPADGFATSKIDLPVLRHRRTILATRIYKTVIWTNEQ